MEILDNVPPADQTLHVVVSTPTFLPVVGGAEVGIDEIYRRIASSGRASITIVTREISCSEAAEFAPEPPEGDVPYRVVRFRPLLAWLRPNILRRTAAATGIAYLIAFLKESRGSVPSVVNIQFLRPHGFALTLLCKLRRIPVVVSLVGRNDVLSNLSPLERLVARCTLALADAVTVNSGFYLRGVRIRTPVHEIPYGVDLRLYSEPLSRANARMGYGIPAEGIWLVALQRLAPVKRLDALIDVFVPLAAGRPDAHLLIVGKGPEERRLKEMIVEKGLAGRVHMLGFLPESEVARLLRCCDLFVSHSMYETFGVMFAQAMASGLPIVAARTSCVPDVVDREGGLLFEPFNSEEFASAVHRYLDDEDLRSAAAQHNVDRSRAEFDWDIIAARYAEVLRAEAHVTGA